MSRRVGLLPVIARWGRAPPASNARVLPGGARVTTPEPNSRRLPQLSPTAGREALDSDVECARGARSTRGFSAAPQLAKTERTTDGPISPPASPSALIAPARRADVKTRSQRREAPAVSDASQWGWKAPGVVGKFLERVVPVTYADPAESTAMQQGKVNGGPWKSSVSEAPSEGLRKVA
jgi:hypothetical protein